MELMKFDELKKLARAATKNAPLTFSVNGNEESLTLIPLIVLFVNSSIYLLAIIVSSVVTRSLSMN